MPTVSLFLLAVSLSTLVPAAARAQMARVQADATIAYISGERISSETADGRAGQDRIRRFQQQTASGLTARQQALEATRRSLLNATDDTERLKLQQQEQVQRTDLEQAAARAQLDLQELRRQVTADMQSKVREALTQLLLGTDIKIVVQLETAVVWAAPGLDLTGAVIERLDARSASPGPAGRGTTEGGR
jgi:Skp family chaperone for outer membrane proteins